MLAMVHALTGAAMVAATGFAQAQAQAPASGPGARAVSGQPVRAQAREITVQTDVSVTASGDVELEQDGVQVRADWLQYLLAEDRAIARGRVEVRRQGSVFTGPQLDLQLKRFEGTFLQPRFEFLRSGSGGQAERIDFLGERRLSAREVRYTSCPRDGSADPAWLLSAARLDLDPTGNEGVAESAVLRFLGVPILAWPKLSFPITEARKSGFLPPAINLDNRSGVELGLPYYWNIAPNLDATLTPRTSTRRGLGAEAELRYLEPSFAGELWGRLLPRDEVAGRSRHALRLSHEGTLQILGFEGARLAWSAERVSDNDWWRDFPRNTAALTPRLLPLKAQLEHPLPAWLGEGVLYARTTRWQVLQSAEAAIVAPYDRSLQLGLRLSQVLAPGAGPRDETAGHGLRPGRWQADLEAEFNRFDLPAGDPSSGRPTGARAHALGVVSRTWRAPGWWLAPRLAVNAAAYDLDQSLPDGRRRLSRTIPTLSLDAGLELERELTALGRALRQTLEPRLFAVHTPWREQSPLLAFDSAPKDFNFSSIFSDNDFTGVDRVSDASQVNAGVTTRLLDSGQGTELLRLGVVQRFLLRTQRITADAGPSARRASDMIVLGSTSVIPRWYAEGAIRYDADIQRAVRSVLSVRHTPGDFRTFGLTYRYSRGASEQVEAGVQWPLARLGGAGPGGLGNLAGLAGGCNGRLYGVGRANYSMRDSRVTDSIVGLEFDAGCWIGRVVVERLSTGRTEATTRLMLQLELVGLSRLGSNPLRVLKDNIPGYQLLREERNAPPSVPAPDPAPSP